MGCYRACMGWVAMLQYVGCLFSPHLLMTNVSNEPDEAPFSIVFNAENLFD